MTKSKWEIRILSDSIAHAKSSTHGIPDNMSPVFYVHNSNRFKFFGHHANCVFSDSPLQSIIGDPFPTDVDFMYILPHGFSANWDALVESESLFQNGADRVDFYAIFQSDGRKRTFEPACLGLTAYSKLKPPVFEASNIDIVDKKFMICHFSPDSDSLIFMSDKGYPVLHTDIEHSDPDFSSSASGSRSSDSRHVFAAGPDYDKVVEISLVHDHLSSFGNPNLFCEIHTIPDNQKDFEVLVRSVKCHWIAVMWNKGMWDWETIFRTAFSRLDRDLLLFPGLALFNPGKVRMLPPPTPDVQEWVRKCQRVSYCSVFDADGSMIMTMNKDMSSVKRPSRGIRVAVLSMCGVTSFEDKYGLGGEHQVVHWLREGFLKLPEVEVCDLFDTYNIQLAEDRYYDLVLSNSCWAKPPLLRQGGVSIFWHFNTNAYNGNLATIASLNYTHVWSNSPSSIDGLKKMGIRASLKHLNASSNWHQPYEYESELFKHDAVYVGGYQTEYKGVSLIQKYVKSMLGHDFDFVIYGNRKWQSKVQEEALKTDSWFLPEHVDHSYDPYYRGVLHPQDFRILAKNCKVWINFNSEDQRPLGMVNDRPIWAMHAGAFVITDESKEQKQLYGQTCDYSSGGDDLVGKVNKWLLDEDKRLAMASSGRDNIVSKGLTTDDTAIMALELYKRENS